VSNSKWQSLVNLMYPMMLAHKKELVARNLSLPAELIGFLEYAHKPPFADLRGQKKEAPQESQTADVEAPPAEAKATPAKKDVKNLRFNKNKPDNKSTRTPYFFSRVRHLLTTSPRCTRRDCHSYLGRRRVFQEG